jgi:hypothetical protein
MQVSAEILDGFRNGDNVGPTALLNFEVRSELYKHKSFIEMHIKLETYFFLLLLFLFLESSIRQMSFLRLHEPS